MVSMGKDGSPVRNVWVLAQFEKGRLREAFLELAAEGSRLAGRLHEELCAVVLDDDFKTSLPPQLQHGVARIYWGLSENGPLSAGDKLSYLMSKYAPRVLLIEETPGGIEAAAMLAARHRSGIITDCQVLQFNRNGKIEASKKVLNGKLNASFEAARSGTLIVTAKKGAFDPAAQTPGKEAEIVVEKIAAKRQPDRRKYFEFVKGDPEKIELGQAEIIIAVGRGAGGDNGLEAFKKMAKLLAASIGGTRVAVDQGWLPFERQIGQTGKNVSPDLLVACGVSGAFEFTAGMKDSKLVVAINKDPEAPINKISDLALIGDVHAIVPAILEKLASIAEKEKN